MVNRRRNQAAAVLLAAAGLLVSAYLAAYQLRLLGGVWDPVFGAASSARVLHSALSRALPVPDALLGASAYAAEASLGAVALLRPGRIVLLTYGAVAALMATTSVGLVAVQAFGVHDFCLLCLVSALVSWAVAALVLPESLTALRARRPPAAHRRRRTHPGGRPARRAPRGRTADPGR